MNAAQRRKTHTMRELVDKGRHAAQVEARAVFAEKRVAELEEELAQRQSYMDVLAREHGLLSAKAAQLAEFQAALHEVSHEREELSTMVDAQYEAVDRGLDVIRLLDAENKELRAQLEDARTKLFASQEIGARLRVELNKAQAEDHDAKKLRRRLQVRSEELAVALQRIHTLEQFLRANYIRI